jgi:hypothetical protein
MINTVGEKKKGAPAGPPEMFVGYLVMGALIKRGVTLKAAVTMMKLKTN